MGKKEEGTNLGIPVPAAGFSRKGQIQDFGCKEFPAPGTKEALYFYFIYFFILEDKRGREEGDGESSAGSVLSTVPDEGLDLTT